MDKELYAKDAERALVGSLLIDTDAIYDALTTLTSDDFYLPICRLLYEIIQYLHNDNKPIDIVTVTERVKNLDKLKEIGGAQEIAALADGVFNPKNVQYYAEIIKEKSILRQLDRETRIIIARINETTDVAKLLDDTEQAIYNIGHNNTLDSTESISQILDDVHANIKARSKSHNFFSGLETGFKRLDWLTLGFHLSHLIIIAARPSMGKSALALNIAANMSIDKGIPVAFFSLEMNKLNLGTRLIAAETRLDSQSVRQGQLEADQWKEYARAENRIKAASLYLDYSGMTMYDVKAKARRLKHRYNIQALFVDYLQLIIPPRQESRVQEVTSISHGLKELAMDLDIAVIAMSQLSRNIEYRGDKAKPKLSDLRESGAIEQDADVVIFIHRPSQSGNEDNTEEIVKLLISKQRDGPRGEVELIFHEQYARFDNYANEPWIT